MSKFWVQLVIGFWVLLSPWFLGFADVAIMKWSNVLCGLILVMMSGWILLGAYGKGNK